MLPLRFIIALLCAFFVSLCAASSVNNGGSIVTVPMVACSANSSQCYYQSAFSPNGTLSGQGWQYFSVDLSGLDYNPESNIGLSAVLTYANVPQGQQANVFMVIKHNSPPTALLPAGSNAQDNSTCNSTFCWFIFPPTAAFCHPKKAGTYYIGVTNTGTSSSVSYLFTIYLEHGGGILLGCNVGRTITMAIILVLSTSFGICFVIALIVLIRNCCRRRRTYASYVSVDSYAHHHHQQLPVHPGQYPQYGTYQAQVTVQ